MAINSNEKSTRQCLIDAAGELFAEKGFRETTVREISERAGANVAAVNYHFGDKEKLYDEVIQHILETVLQKFPIDDLFNEETSPEERLHSYVLTTLNRRHDPERPAWQGILFSQERMNPRSSAFSNFEEKVKQNIDLLNSILEKLLGPSADENQIYLCATSILGQVVYHGLIRGMHGPPLIDEGEAPLTREMIDDIAAHITEFSLAGIKKIRKK